MVCFREKSHPTRNRLTNLTHGRKYAGERFYDQDSIPKTRNGNGWMIIPKPKAEYRQRIGTRALGLEAYYFLGWHPRRKSLIDCALLFP
jgi:hypothetical protein